MTNKPLPAPDVETGPFWEGCHQHRLLLMRCRGCGTYRYPPSIFCASCSSTESEWAEASGRGTVYSWIVVRHPIPREQFGDMVPYVVALIELSEGVRLASNIIGCEPEAITAAMPVEVVFDDVTDEVTLPKFRPAGGAHAVAG